MHDLLAPYLSKSFRGSITKAKIWTVFHTGKVISHVLIPTAPVQFKRQELAQTLLQVEFSPSFFITGDGAKVLINPACSQNKQWGFKSEDEKIFLI